MVLTGIDPNHYDPLPKFGHLYVSQRVISHNGYVNGTPQAVTTRLIHRIQRGPTPWWRTAVIADLTGPLDDAGMERISHLMVPFARLGFDAISVRPSHVNIAADDTLLTHLISRAHRTGLKVIVRLAGASLSGRSAFIDLESGIATVVVRARAALKAGADGIDLGLIDEGPSPVSPASLGAESASARSLRQRRFTELTQILQAEAMGFDSTPILCAEALRRDHAAFHRHLEDEWFHHLRDDSLVDALWDARHLESRVTEALRARDVLGQVTAWQWTRTRFAEPHANVVPGSWAEHHGERTDAMALFTLSLPGACNVAFASPTLTDPEEAEPRLASAFPMVDESATRETLLRHALRVRAERAVGTGSLAFVDHLPWSHPGVDIHLSAGIMVVLNTSATPVEVPAGQRLLVASFEPPESPDAPKPGSPIVVPAGQCAWFEPEPYIPTPLPTHGD